MTLRQAAKRVTPLYWLVGFARYVHFRIRLARQDRRHARRADAPIPPPLLRHRVHGALDEGSYVEVGKLVAASLAQCLNRVGVALRDLDVLDFGCGPGRVAVHFKALAPSCRLHGCDVDAQAIDWARYHLGDIGTFEVNRENPPTRYADRAFNAIYCVSLFTHLDETSQAAWLAELARVTRPGGTVLATVHGEPTHAHCNAEEREQLRESGFLYRLGRTGRFKLDGLPDSYQTTFHTAGYIKRVWSRWFDVVDYVVGGLHGHQDVVILRRRAGAATGD